MQRKFKARNNRRGAAGSRYAGQDELDLPLPSDAQDSKPPAESQESATGVTVFKGSPVESNSLSINQGNATAPGFSKVCILQQLLGGLPSPARASGTPCGPPAHAPAAIAAPTVPPPPLAPAPVYPAFERLCEPPPLVPAPLEPASVSYRDRLRAGGHGALQRAICAGLMPKSMKQEQEWNSTQAPAGQQIWNGGDCWGYQMNQPQTPHNMQHMSPQFDMQPYYGTQQCDMQPMQMAPVVQVDHSTNLHMQAPPTQLPQLPSPSMQGLQMQTPQVFTPTSSGDGTPSEADRCMAILMHPQASQIDRDAVAAQLKAAAYCQCYED